MRFSPSPQRGEGTVRCGFHPFPNGARGLSEAVFTLSLKEGGDCQTRFSPSPQRGVGAVRRGFYLLPKWASGLSDAVVFTLSLLGRGLG